MYAGEHRSTNLLDEDNWLNWCTDIKLAFRVCDLQRYVTGNLKCPDDKIDPVGASNWKYNNDYMKKAILYVITSVGVKNSTQMTAILLTRCGQIWRPSINHTDIKQKTN